MGRPDVRTDAVVDFDHHSDDYHRNESDIEEFLRYLTVSK